MSFTSRIRGIPSPSWTTETEAGSAMHALELIEVRAGVVGDQHADDVAVRADHDPAARVPSDDPLELVEDPGLRVDEALASGEVEPRRVALHRVPELHPSQRGEGPSRPVAGVHLDQRIGDADLQPAGLRQRFQRLDATLQRAGIQRVEPDALEALDERGRLSAAALVEMDPRRSAVQARSRHGREAVTDQEQGRHRVGEHTRDSRTVLLRVFTGTSSRIRAADTHAL